VAQTWSGTGIPSSRGVKSRIRRRMMKIAHPAQQAFLFRITQHLNQRYVVCPNLEATIHPIIPNTATKISANNPAPISPTLASRRTNNMSSFRSLVQFFFMTRGELSDIIRLYTTLYYVVRFLSRVFSVLFI